AVAPSDLLRPALELLASRDLAALPRGPRAHLRTVRSRAEVGFGLAARGARDHPLDAHLALQFRPPQSRGGARVALELLGFAAGVVGVEHQRAAFDVLQQHVTDARHATGGGSR